MIRFLQKDSPALKTLFFVIIAVACVTMVITLVPGIFQSASESPSTYATIRGGNPFTRVFGSSTEITMQDVQAAAQRMLQRQGWPAAALPFVMPQAGKALIQQAVMINEANRLGLQVSDSAVRTFLHSGPLGAALFPGGQYIGDQRYAELIQDNFGISTQKFEGEIKKELEEARLRDLITGPVSVSDSEVRANYLDQQTKIKFTYAVLSADQIAKSINPSDAELQSFFKSHHALYATAVPETRKLQYLAFSSENLPGGVSPVTDAEEQAYYNAHTSDYKVDEQVKVRHILIKPASPSPADDAAAKAKAQGILDQLHKGGNFAELAKQNSDDPGSKATGGELGFIKRGATVPPFEQAAFALEPGQTSGLVKSQFGYHIIQSEAKEAAHTRPFNEVKPQILAALTQQKEQAAQQAFATQLANEAKKSGLAATAAAHHLKLETTDYVQQQDAVLPGLADSAKLLSAAFTANKGAAPQTASTGDGFAVFQVADVRTAHAPEFAAYKDHILSDYRAQQVPVLLEQKTTQLADKAHTANDLLKAAQEMGATVKTSDLVGRTAQVPEIGALATTAPQLFTLKPGQISGPIRGTTTGVIARLDDRQEPPAQDVAQHLPQAKEALLDQNREEAFAVFVSNLTEQYEKHGRVAVSKQAQSMPQLPGQSGL